LTDQIEMFRPAPSVGFGRRWHVFDRELHGFALVAPSPCGFVQAGILCERTATGRERLATGERAVLERRACRLCLEALRSTPSPSAPDNRHVSDGG